MATSQPRLIFCADGNKRHAQIASDAGWLYGARLPPRGIANLPLYFADQDYHHPNRQRYMAELAQRRPCVATVLDWEQDEQLPEVLSWAEEAAQHARDAVIIVPKVPGRLGDIPRQIGDKEVILGYSVPSSYGGSPIGLWELAGWPVHLLGGSPQAQHEIYRHIRGLCDVRSVDGNMAKKNANSRCLYWTAKKSKVGHWQNINGEVEDNAPDECIRRSCANIVEAWQKWVQ